MTVLIVTSSVLCSHYYVLSSWCLLIMCNIKLPAAKSSSCTFKPKSHVYFCLCVQDDTALLFLGQCFESGFGVQQNLRTAIEYYKRAARAGNKRAKSLLTPPNDTDSKGKHTWKDWRDSHLY